MPEYNVDVRCEFVSVQKVTALDFNEAASVAEESARHAVEQATKNISSGNLVIHAFCMEEK